MTNPQTITFLLNGVWQTIGSVAIALLILLFMITIHEFGHYIVAKIFDFKVNEFAIGMGPAIYKKKRKNGEYFSIRALPLGGFCAFEGEDDDASDPRAFNNKKPWQRLLVLVAGATMNFIAAILVFMLSIGCYGQMCVQAFEVKNPTSLTLQNSDVIISLNNKDIYLATDLISALKGKKENDIVKATVERNGKREDIEIKLMCDPTSSSMQDMNNVLSSLGIATISGISETENTNPEKLIKGDVILRVTNIAPVLKETQVEGSTDCFVVSGNLPPQQFFIDEETYLNVPRAFTGDDFYNYVKTLTPEDTLFIYISREGKRICLEYPMSGLTAEEIAVDQAVKDYFGVKIDLAGYRMYSQNVRFGFFESIGRGFIYAFKNVGSTFQALGQLLTGRLGLDALGGPVTTITMTSQVVSLGFNYVLEIMGFIGVSLAVFNLLPIPALDGARAVFVIIEWIRKKPINREVEGRIHAIGLILLLVFAVSVDLIKCF